MDAVARVTRFDAPPKAVETMTALVVDESGAVTGATRVRATYAWRITAGERVLWVGQQDDSALVRAWATASMGDPEVAGYVEKIDLETGEVKAGPMPIRKKAVALLQTLRAPVLDSTGKTISTREVLQ